MIKVDTTPSSRISQGDILRDVEFIEKLSINNGEIYLSKINFPIVVVLTQDCDLEQDHNFRNASPPKINQDKYLLSVLVAPIYNADQVFTGDHLSRLNLKMGDIQKNRTPGTNLKNNETPRYHYLKFPPDISLVDSVIDFKHYFSINVEYANEIKNTNFICQISPLYREDVSQRFSSFLSRVGLP